MRVIRKYLILIIIAIVSIINGNAQEDNKLNILFLGSSYFNFNDLPNVFEKLVNNTGNSVYIDHVMPSGIYLDDHANSYITTKKINERDWDYVILQGVGVLVAYPEVYTKHPVYPAIEKLMEQIKKNCEKTKVVFCLPWAFEDGMTWVQGWSDDFEDMQRSILFNTLDYSEKLGFVIAPVGQAWLNVLKEKKFPLHYLHLSDWNHPSIRGTYLTVCVIYSTIFQKSTETNTYYSTVPQDEAKFFQSIATKMVLNNLEQWNIQPFLYTDLQIIQGGKGELLFQNYPNPFKESTTISFEIEKQTKVNIGIFTISGEKVCDLINEVLEPGKYNTILYNKQLTPGVYICKMNTCRSNISNSMVVMD